MTMQFAPSWLEWDVNKAKIETIEKIDASARTGKQKKDLKYLEKNRDKRRESQAFLACFNEPDMRAAVQGAVPSFKHDGEVNKLLADSIGSDVTITIDQGTHQAEDLAGGGFTLHFDARRPDKKCFHLYVGQESSGKLKITTASYSTAAGFAKVEAK